MATDQIPRRLPTPVREQPPAPRAARGRLTGPLGDAYLLLTVRPLSLYAVAFLRIGYGLLHLLILLREFPHRRQIWGPESPWTPGLARQMFDLSGWSSFLTLSDSPLFFEVCYLAAVLTAVLFTLGWRTRIVSVLFAIVVVAFFGRGLPTTDGGDKLILLMAVYLAFTACGRRWSLDARRARRRAGPDPQGPLRPAGDPPAHAGATRRAAVTILHNCALVVIMAQMCILYGAAGLYKVQGEWWSNGTALHYVLNLEAFRPWPALSDLVTSHPLVLAAACHLTVLVQVAFPFTLFSKLKYGVLAVLTGMHLGIAVLLGMPVFSMAMIIADGVFLPDGFYRSIARAGRRLRRRVA
jgi:hypothetical protein